MRYLVIPFLILISFIPHNKSDKESKVDAENSDLQIRRGSECFQSAKLQKLLPDSVPASEYREIVSPAIFRDFTAKEHFVYSFYYPEQFYQSCNLVPSRDLTSKFIYGQLSPKMDGMAISHRQSRALIIHRDSIIKLMKECLELSHIFPLEMCRQIVGLRAFELIPALVDHHQSTFEFDYRTLSTLCLLMRFSYEPFRDSEIYQTLYSFNTEENSWGKPYRENRIIASEENEKLILNQALAFYKQQSQKANFVKVKGGKYQIGEKGHLDNPWNEVELNDFYISRYEITNQQFKEFVESTDYVSLAEKKKNALVFRLGLDEFEWIEDSTANWRFPNGVSQGGIEDKMNHPVTCISYIDALRYCAWANLKLPSYAQWEVASRAYSPHRDYYFGDKADSLYQHANVWHGKTHLMKYDDEDFLTTSPVGSYKSNALGIFDIYGNVFELCEGGPKGYLKTKNHVVSRGGSWWCSKYACGLFNSVDLGQVHKEASFSNVGFRPIL